MTTVAPRPNAMSKGDVARLLSFIAAFDQRTIGEGDVEAWAFVAAAAHWTLPYAQRAVIEFAATATGERLVPGHITRRISGQRAHFASTYRHRPAPAEIVGDIDAELAWERQQLAAHITACMAAWAAGEEAAA